MSRLSGGGISRVRLSNGATDEHNKKRSHKTDGQVFFRIVFEDKTLVSK